MYNTGKEKYVIVVECYRVMKMNTLLLNETSWMDLTSILNKKSKTPTLFIQNRKAGITPLW